MYNVITTIRPRLVVPASCPEKGPPRPLLHTHPHIHTHTHTHTHTHLAWKCTLWHSTLFPSRQVSYSRCKRFHHCHTPTEPQPRPFSPCLLLFTVCTTVSPTPRDFFAIARSHSYDPIMPLSSLLDLLCTLLGRRRLD